MSKETEDRSARIAKLEASRHTIHVSGGPTVVVVDKEKLEKAITTFQRKCAQNAFDSLSDEEKKRIETIAKLEAQRKKSSAFSAQCAAAGKKPRKPHVKKRLSGREGTDFEKRKK